MQEMETITAPTPTMNAEQIRRMHQAAFENAIRIVEAKYSGDAVFKKITMKGIDLVDKQIQVIFEERGQ